MPAPTSDDSALRAIVYSRGSLQLLDQRKLPHETTYLPANDHETCWTLIKEMAVRGAPAIAVSAALSVAVELHNAAAFPTAAAVRDFVVACMNHLYTSRPTAVNLGEACTRLKGTVESAAAVPGATAEHVKEAVITDAEAYQREDLASCLAIGENGAKALCDAVASRNGGTCPTQIRVMTICNTGALATAGHGTALGVVRTLHASGKLAKCVALETRPWLQGARLTAFELAHEGMPRTLIADSAAAFLMARGEVDACVVGADRIAQNGDTANKIGTYALAIAAKRHGVPFFVAAPTTTVDLNIASGKEIEIEERGSEELTHVRGTMVAASNVPTWNPVFDVTPSDLIEGIITDRGVGWNNGGVVDMKSLLSGTTSEAAGTPALVVPAGYRDLDEQGVKQYIAEHPRLASLMGKAPVESWTCHEVGDGNINFVYIVEAPGSHGVVVKQARPYVRCVGESWPLTLNRMRREASALREEFAVCPEHTPEVYVYDEKMSVMAMQYLRPPHTIARKLLYTGSTPDFFGPHVAEFLAKTLFMTSRLASANDEAFRKLASENANTEMCALTEQVIFTEPYIVASNNRWTTPQLDADAAELREDVALHAGIAALKRKFVEANEALLHGDLHTGSFMLDLEHQTTYAIDPEFAFYGPMGFDIGAVISNLLICFFSQDGWEQVTGEDRSKSREFLLEAVKAVWDGFSSRFVELWKQREAERKAAGEAHVPASDAYMRKYMRELRADALGFSGAKMVRRIVGIAHNADLEEIQDADARAKCERRVLALGRRLVTNARDVVADDDENGVDALVAAASALRG